MRGGIRARGVGATSGRRLRGRLPRLTAIALGATLILAGILAFGRPPAPLRSDAGRAWLAAGMHAVAMHERVLRDPVRPTPANGAFAGHPWRELHTTVWAPRDGGPWPLLVSSHGFADTRHGSAYLARALARLGYVVVAADFPLTHRGAPGGPQILDLPSQPGDVRFLVDAMLAASADPADPLFGRIDPDRIGAYGVSLGGLTTTLVTSDPARRDPRIRAAASLAGPAFLFGAEWFRAHPVPLLMVAGTADRVVPYAQNGRLLPERAPGSVLVAIRNGTHTGFGARGDLLRWLDDPDTVLCWLVRRRLGGAMEGLPFAQLGSAAQGLLVPARVPFCDEAPAAAPALHPTRQRWLVTLAVTSFFESHFHPDPDVRAARRRFLTREMAGEIPEVETIVARGAIGESTTAVSGR